MRLQTFLSHHTDLSRRKAMDVIAKGEVTLNGKVVLEPSTDIDPRRDRVKYQRRLVRPQDYLYVLLNKPGGVVTTKSDRFAEKTVYDLLPPQMKVVSPVGRLDEDTEGLLLLTNDGGLAHQLSHPRFECQKAYEVVIRGQLKPADKVRLERGVRVEGKKTAPAEITNVRVRDERTSLRIVIHEGRKRQIRMMFSAVQYKVLHLKRTAQGTLRLGRLKLGQWRLLTEREVLQLRQSVNEALKDGAV